MFVSDAAILDVSFEVALARSGFRDLITRPGRAVLAVRWETGGHDGEPFPVLDADLTLTAAGPDAALFQLAGVYRAGPDEDGHRTAAMPLGGFLDRIAEAITGRCRRRLGRPGPRSRQGRIFGPSPRHPRTATVSLRCRPWAAPHLVRPRESVPGGTGRLGPMKHITGAALRTAACVVLLVTGLALLAGKDDIRKFHRMRNM